MPKGMATAVILFSLALYNYAPFQLLLQLILAFMVYSLILSTLVDRLSWKFVKDEKTAVEKVSLDLVKPNSKKKVKKKRTKK